MAVTVNIINGSDTLVDEGSGVYSLDLSSKKIRNLNFVVKSYTAGDEASVDIEFAKQFLYGGQKAYVLDESDLGNKTLKKLNFASASGDWTTPIVLDIENFWNVEKFYIEVTTNTPGVSDGSIEIGVYEGKR